MPLPNFLIIGAAKAGTTTLYHHLRQHPEVFMSPTKEPRFFAFEGMTFDPENAVHRTTVTTLASYEKLFQDVADEHAVGEASPSYLSNAIAAERIQRYIPHAKLIAILRNPVERAHSHFLHDSLHGYEPGAEAFDRLVADAASSPDSEVLERPFLRMGFYGRQLEPYIERFDRGQLRIHLFEDLREDELAFAQSIYRFLGVDAGFAPDVGTRHAKTGVPSNRALHTALRGTKRLATWLRPMVPAGIRKALGTIRTDLMHRNLSKPDMSPETRKRLLDIYRDDILLLQSQLDRDLSDWLGV